MPGDKCQIRAVCADPVGFLRFLTDSGIEQYGVTVEDVLTIRFWIKDRDLQQCERIAERKGVQVQLLRCSDRQRLVKQLISVRILMIVIGMLVAVTLWLPTRILFVEVQGNSLLSEQDILGAAESCGIEFGASRRDVRSERVKNQLLSALPDLRWAAVNTVGCRAIITVREETDVPATSKPLGEMYAHMDGIITHMTVTSGETTVREGQAVKKGQLLVGNAESVEAEIFGQTMRQITVMVPSFVPQKTSKSHTKVNYSLLLGKKRINLWKDSGILYTGCDKMYSQMYTPLPGGFSLPLGLERITASYYDQSSVPLSEDEILSAAFDTARAYLLRQMIAGKLLSMQYHVEYSEGFAAVSFHFRCEEMIGRIYDKEIDADYGKDH